MIFGMPPYFDPTRKTTSKKMKKVEYDLKRKKMEDDLKNNMKMENNLK